MTELKKRVFVMMNLTINSLVKSDNRAILTPLEKVKFTLKGSRYSGYEPTTWYIELINQVKTIMYLTEISVGDMIEVLDDLLKHYGA